MTETKNEALNEVKPVGNINRDPTINNNNNNNNNNNKKKKKKKKKKKNMSLQGTNHVQKEVPFIRKLQDHAYK